MMNTRKLKSSISHIRRSKSLIRLFDARTINSSSQHKYQTLKGKNRFPKKSECKDNEMFNVEEGQICDGQKGKIKPVPKGYVAVYVGAEEQRFVIPTRYLSMPEFKGFMEDVGDEYGYGHEGGLRIPYEEHEFEKILRICNNSCPFQKKKQQ